MEKELLLKILEEQRKTNELLQTIASSKEKTEIVKINVDELVNAVMPTLIKKLNKIPSKSSKPKATGE